MVEMTQNDDLCIAEVELQFLGVFKNRVGPLSRIEKNLLVVGFHLCRKTPLPESFVRQHGRENGNFEGVHFRRGGRSRGQRLSLRRTLGAAATSEKSNPTCCN